MSFKQDRAQPLIIIKSISFRSFIIIIEMSRGLFSALSAFTLVTGTALFYFWKRSTKQQAQLVDRMVLKKILIKLRKRAYSTLREIAFIVNHIRTLEGDLQVKKISQIFMRDGGSGQKKLQAIEALVLEQAKISQSSFQSSCHYYCQTDIEIKLLLELFRKDLNMALEGVIENYHGPLPRFMPERVLKIEEQIIKRRMNIICKKFVEKASNDECLRLQAQIQEYLLEEGISHQKEPHEKIFMSMLENYYRNDSGFKDQFERLQMDLELFMIEIESKYLNQNQNKQHLHTKEIEVKKLNEEQYQINRNQMIQEYDPPRQSKEEHQENRKQY